jgi:peptidyl-tRNA hydrolase, PTH1 family
LQDPIQLIVGLGNPGRDYEATRHNVGAWFVEQLAQDHHVPLNSESKFHGRIGRLHLQGNDYWLFIPTTYMNHSGRAVKAIAQFYKISPPAILVAHDELDFPVGITRFKQEGGHGGHNGLRDIIAQLQSNQFNRLRIGIGHPGHRDQVTDYVLSRPSKNEQALIRDSLTMANNVLPSFLQGNVQQAIAQLHNK